MFKGQTNAIVNQNDVKSSKKILLTGLVCAGVFFLSLVGYTWNTGKIAYGVTYAGVPVGQLSLNQAQLKVNLQQKELLGKVITFVSDDKKISISLRDLGLTFTYPLSLSQVYSLDKQGNIFARTINKLKENVGMSIHPKYQWNDKTLKATLVKQLVPFNTPSQDAKATATPNNTIEISQEKNGVQVDIDSIMAKVKKENISNLNDVTIPLKVTRPSVTKKQLEKEQITGVLGSYTSYFNPAEVNRSVNVRLATKAINGTLVKPGENFSFNGTVGERTRAKGYKTGIIIVDNKFVPGLGGGVCQVSSTLYNAVLNANLEVVERISHSLPVTYVPSGKDATVAWPYIDFKFKNNTSGYVLIRSVADNNSVTFTLYGKK